MKLVIFGATGLSGQRLVMQALEAGHEVLAIARSTEKFLPEIMNHPFFKHANANIFSSETLVPHLQGADAVLSCLGVYPSLKWLPGCKLDFYLPSMQAIVAAMKEAKVRRLIVMTVWCTEYNSHYPFYAKAIWTYALGRLIYDFRDMEKMIEAESAFIDYTIVRPPILTPKSRSDFTGENDKKDDPIDVAEGVFIVPGKSFSQANISRSMVAAFMLKCLFDEGTKGKSFAICRK
uniref:NAD(P)-binding domain-containing protein n=1 Tax=Plectus sambesii TaxID=2011161 RepID=A0A914X5F0_9BILA